MSPFLLLTSLSPSPTPSADDDEAIDIPWSTTLFDGLSFSLSDEENEDEPPSLGEGWKGVKRRRLLDPLGQDEEEEESEEGGGEEKGMEGVLFDEADGLILDATRPLHRSISVSSEEMYDDEEEEDGIPWEREMEDLASVPLEDVQPVARLDRQEAELDPEDDKPLSLEERRSEPHFSLSLSLRTQVTDALHVLWIFCWAESEREHTSNPSSFQPYINSRLWFNVKPVSSSKTRRTMTRVCRRVRLR